jgi:hypothetical protein
MKAFETPLREAPFDEFSEGSFSCDEKEWFWHGRKARTPSAR